jgi:DNA polymerase-3 subunit alpha
MTEFTHLHVHSDFSPQDGATSVGKIAEKTARLGMEAVALTDHGRAGGLLQFKKACEEHKVKPIYGCELYVAPRSRLLREKVEGFNTSYHLTVLAKTLEGLRNVFRLTSIGWLDGFYYKPRVDLDVLRAYKEGLVVLSGCSSSMVAHMLLEDRAEEAKEYALVMRNIWKDDFYLEVQNHDMDWQYFLKKHLFDISQELDIPIVATQDSHFMEHEEAPLHQKICKLAAGDLEFGTTETYFKSYNEMSQRFNSSEMHALGRTVEVGRKCDVNWQYGKTIWPVYQLPDAKTPDEELDSQARAGFQRLFGDGDEEYNSRLSYELDRIKEMGFSTYFLVVADFIQWSKQSGIPVGPGRGSGAGSLVCLCMGITEVDPLKYGLYFERFLNPARVSLPDLDIDFCPRGRKEVIQYVASKYGKDRVAQIGTYAQFKPRGALRDFARVCEYEPKVGDRLANLVPPDVAGKQLTFDEAIAAEPALLTTDWPEVVNLARKAEGLRTKAGVHAAGVVISNDDLKTQVPLFRGKGNEVATQFDMHDVEEVGLVKYDFLGLINLTIIQDTIKLVKETRNIELNWERIPENDQKVFEGVFQRGDLDGIFQFETSSGFRDLCVRVRPTSIDDLSTITALFRPGPLGTGLVDKYVAGRNGGLVDYVTPRLEPILKDTYGVMVFQEQIMRICTDLAGYTAPEADNMRKIIGKKIAEKMKGERRQFVAGCIGNSVPEEVSSKLFDDIEGFAKYSFNKAHSVAYSVISYRTAWLKHYYPEEFYASLFNNTIKEQAQLVKYIYSCKERGIAVEPPDINRSGALFTNDNGTILFGLAGVKGIGEKACANLLEKRGEGFESLEHLVLSGANAKVVKALALCGALEGVCELTRGQITEGLEDLIKHYKKKQKWEERKVRIAEREQERKDAVAAGHKPPRRLPKLPDPPEPPELGDIPRLALSERLRLERETLGFYLTGHPLDSYPDLYKMATRSIEQIIDEGIGGANVRLPVVVSVLTKKRTRKGKDMAILIVEDRTGRTEVTVFPSTWKRLQHKIEAGAVALLNCKVDREDNYEGASLVRLILSDFTLMNDETLDQLPRMEDIMLPLADGSQVTFLVSEDTSYEAWQQAVAMVNNLEKSI